MPHKDIKNTSKKIHTIITYNNYIHSADCDPRRDISNSSPPWGRYHTHAPYVRCDPVLISRQLDSDCRPAGRLHVDSELTRLLACSIEISVMQPPRSEWAENDWAVSIIAAEGDSDSALRDRVSVVRVPIGSSEFPRAVGPKRRGLGGRLAAEVWRAQASPPGAGTCRHAVAPD